MPSVAMQHQWSRLGGLVLWGVVVGGAACATAPGKSSTDLADTTELRKADKTPFRPGETEIKLGDESDSSVDVALERGYLNQGDVNLVLEAHTARLTACYDRAGGARRYAEGEVTLRFLVQASGEVSDVLVVQSKLGNFPVERCLVVEGRKIPFPKPGGNRPADFEYNLIFRSPEAHTVVEWKPQRYGRALASKVPSLGRCGATSEGAVSAVAYVRPGGRVVSVGFSSDKPIDTLAAKCVVDRIMTWRLPSERTHLVRTSFPISSGR
ncbi:MAG TPA: AgmX/PglI C-terminal domain-containing protein, partial [Polyangia bacterium]